MYAIIKIGTSQFKVAEGDVIEAPVIKGDVGQEITLDQVLMVAKDGDVKVGQPVLKNANIKAKILATLRGEKVIAFKFRRRKNYSIKHGHRQNLVRLNITKISP